MSKENMDELLILMRIMNSIRNMQRAIKMNLRISLFYFILLGMMPDFIPY